MHVQSACDQRHRAGQCNACCVVAEFMRGVLLHLMMKLIRLFAVFVFKPPTEVVLLFDFTMWQ